MRPTARPIVGGSAAVVLLALVLAAFAAAGASAAPRTQGPRIVFPIVGAVTSWHDDFGEARPIDHEQGNDIGVKPHTPVVAVVDGRVVTHYWGGAGWTIVLTAASGGDAFQYIHLGLNGNRSSAFVAGLRDGQKVKQGQQIAWSGYSGNASIGFPHVEFQYHPHGGAPVDPYRMLKAAPHLSAVGAVPGGGGGVRLTARGDVLWTAGTGDGALMCLHVQHATLTNGKAVPSGRAVVFAVPTSAVVLRDGRPVPVGALTGGDLATVWSRALTGNPATAWTREGGVAAARVQAQTAASGLQAPAT